LPDSSLPFLFSLFFFFFGGSVFSFVLSLRRLAGRVSFFPRDTHTLFSLPPWTSKDPFFPVSISSPEGTSFLSRGLLLFGRSAFFFSRDLFLTAQGPAFPFSFFPRGSTFYIPLFRMFPSFVARLPPPPSRKGSFPNPFLVSYGNLFPSRVSIPSPLLLAGPLLRRLISGGGGRFADKIKFSFPPFLFPQKPSALLSSELLSSRRVWRLGLPFLVGEPLSTFRPAAAAFFFFFSAGLFFPVGREGDLSLSVLRRRPLLPVSEKLPVFFFTDSLF